MLFRIVLAPIFAVMDQLIDLQVDGLDKWILYKFGPKNKYPSTSAVPNAVSVAEIETAKSKFRIFINIIAIFLLVGACFYLLQYAKAARAKHEAKVLEELKKH